MTDYLHRTKLLVIDPTSSRLGIGHAMTKSAPLALIVNVHARRVAKGIDLSALARAGRLSDRDIAICVTLEDLDIAVRRFHAARCIACLGGDGTFHHLVNAALREAPDATLLPLGGGTLNGLAKALGTAGPLPHVLARVATLNDLPHRSVPTLAVSNGGAAFHGFTLGAGLIWRAAEAYERGHRGLGGILRAASLPVTQILGQNGFYAPSRLAVSIDGKAIEGHTMAAGVIENPLLWFRPFGPVMPKQGFRVVATSLSRGRVLQHLRGIYRGTMIHPHIVRANPKIVQVRGEGGFVIDGEMHRSPDGFDITIRAGPRIRIATIPPLPRG